MKKTNIKQNWENIMQNQKDFLSEGSNSYQNKISDMEELAKTVSSTNPYNDYKDFKNKMQEFLKEMNNLEDKMNNYENQTSKSFKELQDLNQNR